MPQLPGCCTGAGVWCAQEIRFTEKQSGLPRVLLVIFIVFASVLHSPGTGAESLPPTIEWAEPADGHWWDPLSWRDATTGSPRVPTAHDSVLISTFPNQTYSVIVDALQTGQELRVASLTVGSNYSLTDCCDKSSGLGNAGCYAALVLRGVSLTVEQELVVESYGVVRFTSPLVGAEAAENGSLCTVTSPLTTIAGWAQGSVTFNGNVEVKPLAKVTMLTLYADATMQYTWAKWLVEGNLTVELQTTFEFYIPENYTAATDPVAQIKTVNLILRKPTAPARKRGLVPAQICIFKEVEKVINIPISGWPPIEPPSLFFFDNFTGGLPKDFPTSYGRYRALPTLEIQAPKCVWYCYNPWDPQPLNSEPCSVSSSHSFSTLLGVDSGYSGCNCPPGRSGSHCQNVYCPGTPACSGRAICDDSTGSPRCPCPVGWTGFACEIPDCPGSPACSGNGQCVSTVAVPFCRCHANWTGPAGQPNDCSVPICSNNCTSPANGVCTAADTGAPHCQCLTGWTLGPDLDCSTPYFKCPGRGGVQCTAHGECNSTSGQCTCDQGWRGLDCSHPDCPGTPDCNHRGECVAVNVSGVIEPQCRCSSGWTGADCSVAECSLGDGCSANGKCVEVGLDPPRCVCSAGWTGVNCSVALTDCAATSHCAAASCVGDATKSCTACDGDWRGADCNTPYCLAANDWSVFPECSGHGSCSVAEGSDQPACQCRTGWLPGPANDCVTPACEAEEGQAECSGHGVCSTEVANPTCLCDAFFYGDSCSIFELSCPGSPADCTDSEHGTCVNGTCQCADKWRGADCSVVRCPGAEENCNGRGTCDSSVEPAQCRCDKHWTGPDCGTPVCLSGCSRYGRCSGDTDPPQCVCQPFWGGPDCSESQTQGSSSDDSSMTAYAAIGGALGGGAVLLIVGVIGAYVVFKAVNAYKDYQINKGLRTGRVNFGGDDGL